MKVIVEVDFRMKGVAYPVSKKPVNVPDNIAAIAIKNGFARSAPATKAKRPPANK